MPRSKLQRLEDRLARAAEAYLSYQNPKDPHDLLKPGMYEAVIKDVQLEGDRMHVNVGMKDSGGEVYPSKVTGRHWDRILIDDLATPPSRPQLDLDHQAIDALKSLGDRYDEWMSAQQRFETTNPRDPQFLPRASKAHLAFHRYTEAARQAQHVTSPSKGVTY